MTQIDRFELQLLDGDGWLTMNPRCVCVSPFTVS